MGKDKLHFVKLLLYSVGGVFLYWVMYKMYTTVGHRQKAHKPPLQPSVHFHLKVKQHSALRGKGHENANKEINFFTRE